MSKKIEGRTLGVIAGDKPMTRIEFINHLTMKNGFESLDPSTFQFVDSRDAITVGLRPGVVVILSGGMQAIPSWQVRPIHEGADNYFWDSVLQDVLGCF
jgi:hypothetical protein